MVGIVKEGESMIAKQCLALSLGLLSLGTALHGTVAQYTKADKKTFDDLIDISFTKSSLSTKARKDKRVGDLRQLSALMTKRLVNIIDGSGLKKEYNTASMLNILSLALAETSGKPELLSANRFATYDFEKEFEASMEAIFNDKVNTLLARPQNELFKELQALLGSYKIIIGRSGQPFTLLTFEDYAQKDAKTNKDLILRLKRVLRPTKEETIQALQESLKKFNQNYEKIISSIKQVTKSTSDILPDSITLDYIKKGGKR